MSGKLTSILLFCIAIDIFHSSAEIFGDSGMLCGYFCGSSERHFSEKYAANVYTGNEPVNPYEKAIIDHCIGEYGVCIDDIDGDKFRYLVAGKYSGGEVPEKLKTVIRHPIRRVNTIQVY